ncbi:HAD-IA family hydrolase [Candidatus Saccharibacteria bacterium]|nr:HAD-IA family hydrolase [Candidatus Saccharibacteria bacterium]
MKRFEALLSDADGTLIDSVPLIKHGQYETAITFLKAHGLADSDLPDFPTYETALNQTVGGSARDTLERTVRMLYSDREHHINGADFDVLHNMLNPVQDRIAPEYIRAYPGLQLLLKNLGTHSLKLAIFTSGTPHHVVRNMGIALPELGLTKLFKDETISDREKLVHFEKEVEKYYRIPIFTVVTIEDTKEPKPDPEGLQIAMKRLSVEPNDCAMLGDHKADMQAGFNATVPIRIGITHGFDDKETLEEAKATEIVTNLSDIKLES